jgi:type I restriction enzyme, S subunit
MKNNKDIKLLKFLCENFKKDIVDGPFGSNLKRSDYCTKGIPVLKIQNIKQFSIKFKKMDYVNPSKYNELKRHSYSNGDIIMTKLGNPLGASAIVDSLENGLIVADLVRIRANKINTKYLCYHLNSPITSDYINSQQKGTTRPRVRIANVRELPIYAPSPSEQKRIVTILDQAFTAIDKAKANTEKNLTNAKELFESYLNGVFGNPGEDWEEKRFDKICVLQRGFDLPSRLRNGGIHPLVSSNGITDRIDSYKVKAPGVVTGRSGSIGYVHYISEDFWPLNTALYIKDFCGNFERCIYYFLKQFNLAKYSSGSGVPTLNRNNIHSEKVWFPKSLKEQQLIVIKLDEISAETKKLESIYQKKITALDELKKSILKKAFEGEL